MFDINLHVDCVIDNSFLKNELINIFLDITKLHSLFIPQNVLFYQLPQMCLSVENMNHIKILYDDVIVDDAIDH